VNQTLGEVWEEDAERADPTHLVSRREPYTSAALPPGPLVMTAGIDTQDDRLEATLVGWGVGGESWVVEHRKLLGDPARPEVWRELDGWLRRPILDAAGGHRHVASACLDSAGHRTDFVYAFAAPRYRMAYDCPRCGPCLVRVRAIIGRSGWDRPITDPDPSKLEVTQAGHVVWLHTLGVDQGKLLVHTHLKLTERGPGYVHLPTSLDEEYLAQLTGEELRTRSQRGLPVREWVAIRPRVEALDCAVMALAAYRFLELRDETMAQYAAQAAAAEAAHAVATAAAEASATPAAATPPTAPVSRPPERRVARSAYLS
jgi:phage terminase large subunit GpA-like protein